MAIQWTIHYGYYSVNSVHLELKTTLRCILSDRFIDKASIRNFKSVLEQLIIPSNELHKASADEAHLMTLRRSNLFEVRSTQIAQQMRMARATRSLNH